MTQGVENDLLSISYYQEDTQVLYVDDMVPLLELNANILTVDNKAILARTTAAATEANLAAHVGSIGVSEHAVATTTSPGFMSKEDKLKLDGIQENAQINVLSPIDALGLISRKNTTLHRHPPATATSGGFISAADKTKLNGIEAGAEVNNIGLLNAGLLTGGSVTDIHGHGFVPTSETFTEFVHSGTNHTGISGVPSFPGFSVAEEFIPSTVTNNGGVLLHTHTYAFQPQILACGVRRVNCTMFGAFGNSFGITDISISGYDGIVETTVGGPFLSMDSWQGGFG